MKHPNRGERRMARATRGLATLSLAAVVSLVGGLFLDADLARRHAEQGFPGRSAAGVQADADDARRVARQRRIGARRVPAARGPRERDLRRRGRRHGRPPRTGHGEVVWNTDAKSRISGGVGSDGFIVAVGTARGDVITFGADGKALLARPGPRRGAVAAAGRARPRGRARAATSASPPSMPRPDAGAGPTSARRHR